jgi:SAM-dependent methyltransferase
MRSDQVVVTRDLVKDRCLVCGLVRSRDMPDADELLAYYGEDYTVAAADYMFYAPEGPRPRSAVLCAWLSEAFGVYRWRGSKRCLEVGAGAGALLEQFARRFPDLQPEGLELGPEAHEAQRRGLNVRRAPVGETPEGIYDLIYSVAVVEHVPSPTQFLTDLRRRLRPGGLLYLCQPTQDVCSYDVFFVDHLHHFGTEHLRAYARKCGFRELGFVVGHELMPNFSLHLWQAHDGPGQFDWHGPPGYTACAEAARRAEADLHRLDETLRDLARRERRVGVFGVNEVFGLARAYSALGDFPLCCGLADNPAGVPRAGLNFPIVPPEACRDFGVQDVILAVNTVYHAQVRRRLEPLGVAVHPVLT